jgi:hypothetical protein
MAFLTWLRWRKARPAALRKGTRPHTNTRRRAFVPRLDVLEDRTLPSTYTVMNLNDSGPGSLRRAVLDANAHPGADTIVFAQGLHGTIKLTSGELSVTDSVTINGPGANQLSVSGNDASRVFETAAGIDVTLSDLTITHGKAADQGGGILNDGANLTLTRDVLSQNVVSGSATGTGGRGGALRSLDGTLTITGCTISGNQALGGTAALGDALGGGVYVLAGNATIKNSTFSGNLARGADNSSDGAGVGGAMEVVSSATITGCTFSGNLARGADNSSDGAAIGAGIYTVGLTSIADSTFSNNLAHGGDNSPGNGGNGGAIYVAASSTTITGTTFDDNQAVGGTGGSGPFDGESFGGAIQNFASVTISGSIFNDNRAVGGNNGDSGPGQADVNVDEGQGGAICAFFGTSTTVSGSIFSHNQAIGGNDGTATGTDIVEVGVAEGGTICSELGASASFTGCTFYDNQAIGGNGNTGSGPVVHVGTGFGAGIFSGFGGDVVGASPLTVSNSLFLDNQAKGGNHNTGTASVAGLVGAGVGGGIMNALGGTAAVSASTLSYNQAVGGTGNSAAGTGAVFANLGAGGALFNWLGNYNSPPEDYGPLGPSVVTLSNCLIASNQAEGQGGNAEGGGIANVLSATTTVASSILVGNEADGDGGGAGLGGGAFNDATSSLTLTKSLVTLNRADGSPGRGGGVYNLGTFTDTDTLIVGNHASTNGNDIGP